MWNFFERNDAKAETPVLWPPHAKSWLIGKDSDAGRDWGQEEKGTTEDEMAGWHHRLDRHESGRTPGVGDGQGGLACCDSWGRKESDMTVWLHFSLLCIGEGNGTPLRCSCLENSGDGGAWWAAVSEVAQSWTRLKQLSSSSKYVGPSQIRDRIHVSCIGRWILDHWATREGLHRVLTGFFLVVVCELLVAACGI